MQKTRLKVSRVYLHNSNQKGGRRVAKCGSKIYEFDPTYGLDWQRYNGALFHDQAAIDFVTWARWRDGDFCPLCGCENRIYDFSDRRTHKCGHCRRRFSIKVGTIFQGSKLSVRQWLIAVKLASIMRTLTSSQLEERIHVSRKTALAVLKQLKAWNFRRLTLEEAVFLIVDSGRGDANDRSCR